MNRVWVALGIAVGLTALLVRSMSTAQAIVSAVALAGVTFVVLRTIYEVGMLDGQTKAEQEADERIADLILQNAAGKDVARQALEALHEHHD